MEHSSTAAEWEAALGTQLRALRLRRGIDQVQLARISGIALNAVKNLESGRGATVSSLIKVLRALDRIDWLKSLAPAVSISPLQMLKAKEPRQRAPRRVTKQIMYKPVNAIEVRVWGQRAGAVGLEPGLGYYAFEYDPKFLRRGIELAPLQMPLARGEEPFIFPALPELTFKRLPAMLSDALPDDFGKNLIDAWLAKHGVEKQRISALDRLAYMGKRGMGAMEFKPSRGAVAAGTTAIKLSKLVDAARATVHGEIDSDDLAEAALNQIIQVGTSAGGARAKAVVAWNPNTDEIRAGQFDVEAGYEHWLLKFDGMGLDRELGGTQDYGRVDYAYYLMAKGAGIEISACRLLEENGRAHFMTRRFDRDGNTRHHMQTLCAMAHLDYRQTGTHDYSQLFLALTELGLDYSAKEEAFRRMVFNVLAANCDDHTKNTSFILREGAPWQLAPAYDVTHAFNPRGANTYQHLMSVNGKFTAITRADFLAVGDRFGVGSAREIIREVRSAIDNWDQYATEAGLTPDRARKIREHHQIWAGDS